MNNNDLQKVIEINLEDARHLVRIFRASGDKEKLEAALADLNKWEKKAKDAMTVYRNGAAKDNII